MDNVSQSQSEPGTAEGLGPRILPILAHHSEYALFINWSCEWFERNRWLLLETLNNHYSWNWPWHWFEGRRRLLLELQDFCSIRKRCPVKLRFKTSAYSAPCMLQRLDSTYTCKNYIKKAEPCFLRSQLNLISVVFLIFLQFRLIIWVASRQITKNEIRPWTNSCQRAILVPFGTSRLTKWLEDYQTKFAQSL